MLTYTALFEPDKSKKGYVVTFPDFDWGVTQGDTLAEALEMAVDALQEIVGEQIRKGEPLPSPRRYNGAKYRRVELPALLSAKAELYIAFMTSGIRKVDLARKLGIPKSNVERLFSFRRKSHLDQIEAAAAALGCKLTISVLSRAA